MLVKNIGSSRKNLPSNKSNKGSMKIRGDPDSNIKAFDIDKSETGQLSIECSPVKCRTIKFEDDNDSDLENEIQKQLSKNPMTGDPPLKASETDSPNPLKKSIIPKALVVKRLSTTAKD